MPELHCSLSNGPRLVSRQARGDIDVLSGPFRRVFCCRVAGFGLVELLPASTTDNPHRSIACHRNKKWFCRTTKQQTNAIASSRRRGCGSQVSGCAYSHFPNDFCRKSTSAPTVPRTRLNFCKSAKEGLITVTLLFFILSLKKQREY